MTNTTEAAFSAYGVDRATAGRAPGSSDRLAHATKRLHELLLLRNLGVTIAAGSETFALGAHAKSDAQRVEFRFHSLDAFDRVVRKLRLFEFALAYVEGDMEIEGPLENAIDILDTINASTDKGQNIIEATKIALFRIAKAIVPPKQIAFESNSHYSQKPRAYELFLDEYMQYTCGRFYTGIESIDEAQQAKFSLIAEWYTKHVGTLNNTNHLDIGCGWGGLLAYFSDNFGTLSIGNTNCRAQMEYAEERFGATVLLGDFLDISNSGKQFDFITILGMIEHLTPYRRTQLFRVLRSALRPGGVIYLQCIAKPRVWRGGDIYRFAQREVFPGHYLELREDNERRLRRLGFSILEQCDDAQDYSLTTSRWAAKIKANENEIKALVGCRQYRLYHGYLSYASKLFATGRGNLTRYLLQKV
jgi:cyclopropane-fatty-acyl-phospholipid synthase